MGRIRCRSGGEVSPRGCAGPHAGAGRIAGSNQGRRHQSGGPIPDRLAFRSFASGALADSRPGGGRRSRFGGTGCRGIQRRRTCCRNGSGRLRRIRARERRTRHGGALRDDVGAGRGASGFISDRAQRFVCLGPVAFRRQIADPRGDVRRGDRGVATRGPASRIRHHRHVDVFGQAGKAACNRPALRHRRSVCRLCR